MTRSPSRQTTKKAVSSISLILLGMVCGAIASSLSAPLTTMLTGAPHTMGGEQSAAETGKVCLPADKERAREHLLSLFPDAVFFAGNESSDDIRISCLLPVEMMTDWSDSATRGTVYFLPDGKTFLNGPLYTEDSVITPLNTSVASQPDTSTVSNGGQDLSIENVQYMERVLSLLDEVQNEPAPTQANEEGIAAARTAVLESIGNLPNQLVFFPENENKVYVAFDPLCPRCHEFFAIQDEIAHRYQAQLIWIPTYLNNESRDIAAKLVEVAGQDSAQAQTFLELLMSDSYDGPTAPASDDAYTQLDQSAEYIRSLAARHGFGTPLIVFANNSDNDITIINGLPPIDEFEPLAQAE